MDPKNKPTPRNAIEPTALEGTQTIALDCELFFGPDGPLPTGVTHLPFADLTPATLGALNPGHIILPLFAIGHDAFMVIERLEEMGYTGRLTVLAPALPKPRLVERDLRSLVTGSRLTLISP